MSKNSPDDLGSPSDRFLPNRPADTTFHAPIPMNRFQPRPTSDLSQAIGNMQHAMHDHCQVQNYQQPNYQPPNLSWNRPLASAITRNDPPGSSRAKARAKWSSEEDTLIINLRGKDLRWEDIAKQLPGRSATACRLHYQNYLEKDVDWDEDRKDHLARVYDK
jgi:hypothetical protein